MFEQEVVESSEIVIIQNQDFKFWLHKNRHGADNYFLNPSDVEALFGKEIRVSIISPAGKVIADNKKQNPFSNQAREYNFEELTEAIFGNSGRSKEEKIYFNTEIYPHLLPANRT